MNLKVGLKITSDATTVMGTLVKRYYEKNDMTMSALYVGLKGW